MQWHSAKYVSLFSTFYIYMCVCNAHTLLMTARNKTAMFQNLRTVSDIVSPVIQQQQRGTGLSSADYFWVQEVKCTKTLYSVVWGNSPREVVREGGVVFNLSTSIIMVSETFSLLVCNSEKNFQVSLLWKCSSSTLSVLINAQQTVSMEGHVKTSKFILYHKAEMLIRIRIRLSLVNPRQNTWHLCFHWRKNL